MDYISNRINCSTKSHLTRGAWIEIPALTSAFPACSLSHLTRGAWIEIKKSTKQEGENMSRTSHEVRGLKLINASMKIQRKDMSHLTRGAWIEIPKSVIVLGLVQVAPHTRCVD